MMLRFRLTAAALCVMMLLAAPTLRASQNTSQEHPDQQLHTASREELDVIKILLHQEDAWNHGDLEAFVQSYKNSPDTLFLSGRVNRGFAGLLEEYRHDYPNKAAMGTLGFSELEVHTLDERFAVCIGKYRLDRGKKEGGPAEGLFSLVLEKTDQGWKIVVDHTT